MIEVTVLNAAGFAEPALSDTELPEEPDAPQGGRSWLWAGVAMAAIIGMGGVVDGLSTRYAGEAPPDADRVIDSLEAQELCAAQLAELGIDRFTVPAYIAGDGGTNAQTRPPWRLGTEVKAIPLWKFEPGQKFGGLDETRIVTCTLSEP